MGGDRVDKKKGQKKTAEEVLKMPHVTLKGVENVMMQVETEMEDVANQSAVSNDEQETKQVQIEQQQKEPMSPCPASVYDTVEATVKYDQYVRRQAKDMESWRKAQGMRIPPDIVYTHEFLPTLRNEELEKLNAARPTTFAEASQISGLNPDSLVYLYHHVSGRNRQRDTARGNRKNNQKAKEEAQRIQATQ